VGRKKSLVVLFHHRWSVPIIAELYRRQGERFAYLAGHLAVSRETLSQTLGYLVRHGLVRRNPGYGHPLRPEYLLTESGEALGPHCLRLVNLLDQADQIGVGLKKWTMPIVHRLGVNNAAGRFSDLLKSHPLLTPKSLSDSLKLMEDSDLISREVTEDFPPSTRYSLTAIGRRYLKVTFGLERALT
jgi:DNA-binding HxlR family transcriptional regulator